MKSLPITILLALGAVSSLCAQSDTQAPNLVGLSISPASVDVTLAAKPIVFSLQVTDDLSGVNLTGPLRTLLYLQSPSKAQTVHATIVDQGQTGVILNANNTITVSMPRYAEPGIWTIQYIRLMDLAGNVVRPTGTELAAAGFPVTVNVIDATPDFAPPQLAGITMSPSSLVVSASDVVVTVNMTVTDDASGFVADSPGHTDFEITSPSSHQSRFIPISDWKLISGTSVNGVWQASFVMPRYSEPGIWRIVSLRLHDRAGSQRIYSASDLAPFGSAVTLSIASSPFDSTSPLLSNMTFNQAVIDPTTGPITVVAQMTLSDDLSGISVASDRVQDTNYLPFTFGGISFKSPSGAQTVYSNAVPSSGVLLAGNTLSGLWSFDAVFPQFCEAGTWTATVSIRDATRNVRTYSGAQLAALGVPQQIFVIRPSLLPDGVPVNSAGGTVVDDTFGNRAELIVPAGIFSQPTTVAIDVLQSPVSIALPSGFSSADSYFVNVDLVPKPTFPLASPGITVVLPLTKIVVPGTQLSLHSIDPITGSLVPALDVNGVPIVGLVDVGGQTATFSGVSHFSTLVGLVTNVVTVVPLEVTSQLQFTQGGFRLNRLTGRYAQTITIKNIGSQDISGPVSVVFGNIPTTATLSAPTGVTTAITPTNSPYFDLNIGSDNTLSVGETVTLNVEFSNPTNKAISYLLRAFAGPGSR